MDNETKSVTVQGVDPWIAAMPRALIVAALTGVVAAIGAYQLMPDVTAAVLVGVSTAATAVLVRMGEGGYDQGRAVRTSAASVARFDK